MIILINVENTCESSRLYMCNVGGYLEVIGAHFIDVWSWSGQGFIPKTELQKKLVSP